MKGVPFSFTACEARFGPECTERKAREAREAPRFTPEQILAGQRIFATFGLGISGFSADPAPARTEPCCPDSSPDGCSGHTS